MRFSKINTLLVAVTGLFVGSLHAVSIQDLINQGKLPKARFGTLNLSGYEIDDLQGIKKLDFTGVRVLRLRGNKLRAIPRNTFKGVKGAGNIVALDLGNNDIESLQKDSFEGLKGMVVLVLSSNQIEDMPDQGLSGMPRLKWISIFNNPMPSEEIKQQESQMRGVYFWNEPITRARLIKAGAATAGIVAIILAAIGVIYLAVKGRGGESKEEVGAPEPISEGWERVEWPPQLEEEVPYGPEEAPERVLYTIIIDKEGTLIFDKTVDPIYELGAMPDSEKLKVKKINLNYQTLDDLPQGIFKGFSNLEELDLSNNELKRLPDGIFRGLSRLTVLDLSHNKLTSISENEFKGPVDIKWLDLSNNSLNEVKLDVFGVLAYDNLTVDLSYNQLSPELVGKIERYFRNRYGDRGDSYLKIYEQRIEGAGLGGYAQGGTAKRTHLAKNAKKEKRIKVAKYARKAKVVHA